jgi:carbon-monoxide dehydrogenase large subunit
VFHEIGDVMMNHVSDEALAQEKFAVGQPVLRSEDPILLRGQGRYTDDVACEGQLYMAMVRSPIAHGRILSLDTSAALALEGVRAVYTGVDLQQAGYQPLPSRALFKNRDGSDMKRPMRFALAVDKVRFVGDPIACVIATTAAGAQLGAESVRVDYEELPAVIDPREALSPEAPQIYDDIAQNLSLDYHWGDSDKVAAAFAGAAHITKLRMLNTRVVVNAMEPRALVAHYAPADQRFTLYIPSQGVTGQRANLAEIFGLREDQVRVIAQNVGGSFGMKGSIFPEYVCAMHGARALGHPIKWTDSRSSSFVADHHGRDQDYEGELALDAQGHFLAVRMRGYANVGAYLSPISPLFSTFNIVKHVNSAYRMPLIEVATKCVVTNTVPITAYRGAGRPEGNYYMERLIECAAIDMGIDAIELRRRNHIQPQEMPYKAACGSTYDSGDFPAVLKRALEVSDWQGFEQRRHASHAQGKLRGRGVGQFVETTAPLVNELGAIHFEADGQITLITGTHDHGQGHATSFAQIISAQLAVPFERIRLMQSDSDQVTSGGGTGGSKSLLSSGTAFVEAGKRVIETGRLAASFVMETDVADIEFSHGQFRIAGTDRALSVLELEQKLRTHSWPEACPKTLSIDYVHAATPATFPNGCHVAEVEIDPQTGVTELVRYAMVGDFGTIVNPIIVRGQLQGGVVQGLGQCLMENTIYDAQGQLLTGSFMDYAMPHASDVPQDMIYDCLSFPATTNPLGVKGCGEAGCAGSMASIMNAVVDALRPYGVTHFDMPASPQRVWQVIMAHQQMA